MTEIYVGTSGWLYSWNLGSSLDWYVENSGLNAVELNASFYRYPSEKQIRSWVSKGSSLRWAVKINRSVSHVYRLREKSIESWRRFRELFEPMKRLIDFYLLQLPPSYVYSDDHVERIRRFLREASESRIAIEFRHETWFELNKEYLCSEFRGSVIVSVDSPERTWFIDCEGIVYLRLHGRTAWYLHEYTREELEEITEEIASLDPDKVYVFFNNNHWMLSNAREMLKLLRERL